MTLIHRMTRFHKTSLLQQISFINRTAFFNRNCFLYFSFQWNNSTVVRFDGLSLRWTNFCCKRFLGTNFDCLFVRRWHPIFICKRSPNARICKKLFSVLYQWFPFWQNAINPSFKWQKIDQNPQYVILHNFFVITLFSPVKLGTRAWVRHVICHPL